MYAEAVAAELCDVRSQKRSSGAAKLRPGIGEGMWGIGGVLLLILPTSHFFGGSPVAEEKGWLPGEATQKIRTLS